MRLTQFVYRFLFPVCLLLGSCLALGIGTHLAAYANPLIPSGAPVLVIPDQVKAQAGEIVTLPVIFNSGGNAISSIAFSVDYDQAWLSFNPADSNADGIPDAVVFNIPAAFGAQVIFDAGDPDGELDIVIADFVTPLAALPDAPLVTITFLAGIPPGSSPLDAAVNFSQDPVASFGKTDGYEVKGTTDNGSVQISKAVAPTYTPTPTFTPTPTPTTTPTPTGVRLNLPITRYNHPPAYTISGRVSDSRNNPLSGVTIQASGGLEAVTGLNGEYSLTWMQAGQYTLSPFMSGYTFSPAVRNASLPPAASNQNFVGIAVYPPTSCLEKISNGGFEYDGSWEMPVTQYRAGYYSGQRHTGIRAMRTGILEQKDNLYSYSSARQKIKISSGIKSATLRFWIYTASSNTSTSATFPEPALGDAAGGADFQYVLLQCLQNGTQQVLVRELSNQRAWILYEFDVLNFAGQTVQLEFGSVNNGIGGVTAMVVDDVSLLVCK